MIFGNSQAVQWLGLDTFTAKTRGWIPDQELRSHRPHSRKKKKSKKEKRIISCMKYSKSFTVMHSILIISPSLQLFNNHCFVSISFLKIVFWPQGVQDGDTGTHTHTFHSSGSWFALPSACNALPSLRNSVQMSHPQLQAELLLSRHQSQPPCQLPAVNLVFFSLPGFKDGAWIPVTCGCSESHLTPGSPRPLRAGRWPWLAPVF